MSRNTNENEPMNLTMPGWAKAIFGGAVAGVIFWKAPIIEILSLFFYIVLIPLALLSAIGLIGSGLYETLGGSFNRMMEGIRAKVADKRQTEEDDFYEEPRQARRPRPSPQA